MPAGDRRFRVHRAVKRKRRPRPYPFGKGVLQKWKFYDQVVGRTMETCFVELISLAIQAQMGVLVISYQGMDRLLRRDCQRK